MYRADGVEFTKSVEKKIKDIEALGSANLPICMAKTQYSFSDDPTLLGAPEGFKITISDIKLSNGAGFIVVLTGEIMTMPGLPRVPAANNIDIKEDGESIGLFLRGYRMSTNPKYKSKQLDELFEAILMLKTKDDCYKFFEDACTVRELNSIAQRLEVANC